METGADFTIPFRTADEAGALGCVLLANGNAAELLDQLEEEYFHDVRHIEVFRKLITIEWDSAELTVPTLIKYLESCGAIERAGGLQYVASLPDTTPSVYNFQSHLDILREYAARRKTIFEAQKEIALAQDLTKPVDSTGVKPVRASLIERKFSIDKKPADILPIYSLCGNAVCTVGNLTSIVSQAKTGKSAVVGAMIAATMASEESKADLLGFTSSNPAGRAIVHVDTEQSPDDAWHLLARSVRRAGIEQAPAWLHSFCLTGLLPREIVSHLREAIALAEESAKGLHSILIDGVADLVHDVNDAGECNDMVATLHGLAIAHGCPIICVLHFNPDSAKARGHLGSQLERKAESNLRLDKEEDATVLWSNKQRRAAISKDFGPRFAWNDEAGMHLQIESRSQSRRGAKAEAAIPYRDEVFAERPAMRFTELVKTSAKLLEISERTAKRRVNEWCQLGIIEKTVANLWQPKN